MTGPAPLSCHKMSATLFAVNYATTNHHPNVYHYHPNIVRRHSNVYPQPNVIMIIQVLSHLAARLVVLWPPMAKVTIDKVKNVF